MNHLTDDQFAECLTAAAPEPAIQSHLAQCDECRTELGVFLAAMADFSAAALDWSKSQPVVSPRARWLRTQQPLVAPLRWALAAALIAAVGVPLAMHHERAKWGGNLALVEAEAEDSPAQIAQDNNLLRQVDVALGESDPSPYQEYGLDVPRKRTRARAQTRFE